MKELKCICCESDINPICYDEKDKAYEAMYEKAITDKISAGYGSIYDGDLFLVSICDKCISEKLSKNVIKYIGNY